MGVEQTLVCRLTMKYFKVIFSKYNPRSCDSTDFLG